MTGLVDGVIVGCGGIGSILFTRLERLGVKDFVVPGNKPEKIIEYKGFLESLDVEPILYSPGLISQGGSLTESAKAAGNNWHAIVGRALYNAKDINKAAKELVKSFY